MRGTKKKNKKTKSTHPIMLLHLQPVVLAIIDSEDGQFDDCTKDVLEEPCEGDYSDAEEELEANLDTD